MVTSAYSWSKTPSQVFLRPKRHSTASNRIVSNWLKKVSGLLSLSDDALMQRVQQRGDPRAYAELLQRWQGRIQRLCTRMTGDAHIAEDLTQEVFLRVYRSRLQWRRESKFSTWLWRIALNTCTSEHRRKARDLQQPLGVGDKEIDAGVNEFVVSPQSGPPETLQRQELAAMVRLAVLELPDLYRGVVVLRHYERLKFREIAAVLRINEGTVKSRMAQALQRLEKRLKPKINPQRTKIEFETKDAKEIV